MSREENVKSIIVMFEIIVTWIVCIPSIIYLRKKFKDISDFVMIQKRHPHILEVHAILVTLWFIFGAPLMTVDFADLYDDKTLSEIVTRLNYAIAASLSFGMYLTMTWRFWHIFYDLKHSSSTKNSEWKYHLDPSLIEDNFWLKHKKDFGSSTWTKKIIIIWFIISISIIIICYQCVINTNYLWIGHIINAMIHSVAAIIALALSWKVPNYNDHFFVKDEMKMISIQVIIVMAIASGFAAAAFFISWMMMGISFSASILFFDIFIVSYWWIPKKIDNITSTIYPISNQSTHSIRCESNGDQSPNSQTHVFPTPKQNNLNHIVNNLSAANFNINVDDLKQERNVHAAKSYTLHTILSDEKSFKIFMQHLAKEFSTECLLCFAEIMQFKFLMKQRYDIIDPNAITAGFNFNNQYPLSDVAPLSAINRQGFEQNVSKYKKNDPIKLVNETKKVCLELFYKYIVNGSELEVNVSYKTKIRLTNLMSDVQFWMQFNILPDELFCLYDETATAMFRLMDASFVRFKNLPSYQTAVQMIND